MSSDDLSRFAASDAIASRGRGEFTLTTSYRDEVPRLLSMGAGVTPAEGERETHRGFHIK